MGCTDGYPIRSTFPQLTHSLIHHSRQKTHLLPKLTGVEKCPELRPCLRASNREDFDTPRTLDGLDVYFTLTPSGLGYLTSLLILGMALLLYAIDHLEMEELRDL